MYEQFQAKLDGKSKNKPVPYDAHEQVTRGEHVPTGPGAPDKKNVEQYPKAIDHTEAGEPVIARDAAHEKELKANAKSAKD